MSACDRWASFKFSQIILCLSCLLYKRWSDAEASRLFYYFEKTSREWPLLNNITRNGAGSLFADVTFGGYIIICLALFIAYLMGELKNSKKTESFLLAIGALLFIGVGCLVMSSVDSVPRNLIVNAVILAALSTATGMVFVLDTCLSNRRDGKKTRAPDDSRYGDVARTRIAAAIDAVDSARAANGAHKNGAHAVNGTHNNGAYVNGTHKNGAQAVNGTHKNGSYAVNGTHKNGTHAVNGKHKNGAHAVNGTHKNGSYAVNGTHKNGAHADGHAWETAEQRLTGLLQTTAATDRERRRRSAESVQSSTDEATDDGRQYGRRRLDDRGFGVGHRHAEWFDTDMDLSKMKKLEVNVQHHEESPEYHRRFVSVKNGIKLQSPSITSTVQQQESPKEENEHEVKNARVPYVMSEKRSSARPTDLPLKSPVERVNDSLQKSVKNRYYFGTNMEEPKSPNDPGYVLHTASRWEEQSPAAVPQNGYKQFKRSQV